MKQIPYQTPTAYHVAVLDKVSELQESKNSSCIMISNSLDQAYIRQFTSSNDKSESLNQKEIFKSQNYAELQEIFKNNNICYIHFDDTKKSFSQLHRPPEGLDFIVTYSDNFRRVYSNQGQKIYYYTGLNELE